jgi:ABC-type Mn2+/Zn2+ transport system ATPase subunit
MLESDARLIERIIKVKGRKYSQIIIYVPRSLATDSAFPFKPRDMVRLSIAGETLTIQKAELPYMGVDDSQENDTGNPSGKAT